MKFVKNAVGDSYQDEGTSPALSNIRNVLDYDFSGIDIFPKGADVLDSIDVKTKADGAYTLPTQYVGQAFNPDKGRSGNDVIKVTAHYTNTNTKDVTSDVTYKLGTTDALAATPNSLTDLPDTFTSADMTGDKYVYAVYTEGSVTKAYCLGQLTVEANTITDIAVKSSDTTFGNAPGHTHYAGDNVLDILESNDETLTVTLTYKDTTTADVKYAGTTADGTFKTNGIALYVVNAEGKLEKVTDDTKLAEGDNEFYVALDDDTNVAGKEPSEVTIKTNKLTIKGNHDSIIVDSVTGGKFTYKPADTGALDKDTIDFSDVQVEYHKASSPTVTETKSLDEIKDDVVVFWSDEPVTYNADHVITSGTTKYDESLNGKKVYIVDKTDASDPAKVTANAQPLGTLGDRAAERGDLTGEVGADSKYGDKLKDKLNAGSKITVTYDNGDTQDFTYDQLKDLGAKMRVVDDDGNVVGTYENIDPDDNFTLSPDMNGNKLEFYIPGTAGDGSDDIELGSTTLTVAKKEVHFAPQTQVEVKKTYDAETTVEAADVTALNNDLKITATDLLAADQALADTLYVSGITYAYSDKNAGNDKTVTVNVSGATAAKNTASDDEVTKFNANYKLVPADNAYDTGSVLKQKGEIEKKKLEVTAADLKVPSRVADGPLEGTKDNLQFTKDTTPATLKDDVVTLSYKYTYPAGENTPETIPDVTISEAKLTSTDGDVTAGNYDLVVPATAPGKITNKSVQSVTPKGFKAEYTYPDTTLSLDGITVDVLYSGATEATTMSLEDFLKAGGKITFANKAGQTVTVTDANYQTLKETLAYGSTNLTFTAGTEAAAGGSNVGTAALTVNKKKIKLSDVTLGIEKKYDGETTYDGAVADPAGVEDADKEKLTLKFKATFEDANASADDKDVTLSDITLEGDAAENYEIDNDISSKSKGKINKGDQDAPDAPKVKVDPKTNNIVPDTENGYVKDDTLEYSIDGATWVDEPNFENLTKGQTYTVQARKKGDDNHESSPSANASVTTFKNHVVVYKVNTTTVLAEAYTDVASVADDNGFNSSTGILGAKPTRFKAYYTDKEGKTKIEYPFTLKAETELYMTQTTGGGGGGGGGGGSSVTVKFPESNLEGYVGETLTLKPTITGTTSKPTWKSTNENIATVDENGNVKLLKEGEARITVSVGGVQKSVGITVKPAPDKTTSPSSPSTPTPTPAPLIDVEYTKPYASGYDDGTFLPDNNITRAELASMIARLINGDDIPDGVYDSSFPDIADDAWYNKYVGYLEAYNVISGYEDGTYRPENQVTRGELAAVITRAQKYDIVVVDDMFTDVTPDNWAKDSITTLATRGVVSGYSDGTFAPYAPLTRAEAVTMINNVLAPSTAIVTFTPTDISGYWAENNIILAVNERQVNGSAEATEPEETPAPDAETTPAPEGEETPAE